MSLWPPDWTFIFCIVAFALASLAAQSWRELGVLIALASALIFPIKWLGAALGVAALTADAFLVEAAAGKVQLRMGPSAALIAAIILGASAMIGWRHVTTPPNDDSSKVGD